MSVVFPADWILRSLRGSGRDISCCVLWVFSGERAAAQYEEGRRSPESISCANQWCVRDSIQSSQSEDEGCDNGELRPGGVGLTGIVVCWRQWMRIILQKRYRYRTHKNS